MVTKKCVRYMPVLVFSMKECKRRNLINTIISVNKINFISSIYQHHVSTTIQSHFLTLKNNRRSEKGTWHGTPRPASGCILSFLLLKSQRSLFNQIPELTDFQSYTEIRICMSQFIFLAKTLNFAEKNTNSESGIFS